MCYIRTNGKGSVHFCGSSSRYCSRIAIVLLFFVVLSTAKPNRCVRSLQDSVGRCRFEIWHYCFTTAKRPVAFQPYWRHQNIRRQSPPSVLILIHFGRAQIQPLFDRMAPCICNDCTIQGPCWDTPNAQSICIVHCLLGLGFQSGKTNDSVLVSLCICHGGFNGGFSCGFSCGWVGLIKFPPQDCAQSTGRVSLRRFLLRDPLVVAAIATAASSAGPIPESTAAAVTRVLCCRRCCCSCCCRSRSRCRCCSC